MEVHGRQRKDSADPFAHCELQGGLRTMANFSSVVQSIGSGLGTFQTDDKIETLSNVSSSDMT